MNYRLEHSPELGLSVAHGKFESGAAVVLANVTVANDSNKFSLNAFWLQKCSNRLVGPAPLPCFSLPFFIGRGPKAAAVVNYRSLHLCPVQQDPAN